MDAGGRVIESRDATCEDDAAAEELARGIVADTTEVRAIEIWLRPRLISRVGGGAGGSVPAPEPDPIVRARPRPRRR